MKNRYYETVMKGVFAVAALFSVAAVAIICLFLLYNGVPAIREIGFWDFVSGTNWKPLEGEFGIFPMIVASLYMTAGAIILGVPTALLTAVFLARFCGPKLYKILKPLIDLLAAIPSIVYGFFGLMVVVPMVQEMTATSGKNILTGSLILAIMILPTIISVAESSIRAVPNIYYEGSLALGVTHERSVFCTVLPPAKSGIMAGIILGIGRAVGETMAVVMVAGNQAATPTSLFDGARTLTANIVLEMGYAGEGLHRNALIATAVVLFVFVLIINLSFSVLRERRT